MAQAPEAAPAMGLRMVLKDSSNRTPADMSLNEQANLW